MAFQWNTEAAQQAEENNSRFEALPEGSYRCMINRVEDKETKVGGSMLSFEFEIIEGKHAGRKIWDNANYKNANPKAEEIAWRTITNITKLAFGEAKQVPLNAYEGKILVLTTKNEEWNGNTQVRVKSYKADGAISAPAAKPAAAKPATKPSEAQDDDVPF